VETQGGQSEIIDDDTDRAIFADSASRGKSAA